MINFIFPLDQLQLSFRALLVKVNLVKFPRLLRSALHWALYDHPRKQFVNPLPTMPPKLYLLPIPKLPLEDPQILLVSHQHLLLFYHILSLSLPYRHQSTTPEGIPLNLL